MNSKKISSVQIHLFKDLHRRRHTAAGGAKAIGGLLGGRVEKARCEAFVTIGGWEVSDGQTGRSQPSVGSAKNKHERHSAKKGAALFAAKDVTGDQKRRESPYAGGRPQESSN